MEAGSGTLTADTAATYARVGVWDYFGFQFKCWETFLGWDTSGIGDSDVISSATVELVTSNATDGGAGGTFGVELFIYDYSSGGITTADWRTPTHLGSLTKVATATLDPASAGATVSFTDVAMPANVNKTGYTYTVLVPTVYRSGGTLSTTNNHYASIATSENGSANDPILTVVHNAPVSATAAAALGALTSTATAKVKHPATLTAALGVLTATASATKKVIATASAALGVLTGTASPKVKKVATAAAPLGGLTSTAAATVKHPATLSAPLGTLTATASATKKVIATASAPLGVLTGTAAATAKKVATAAAPLGLSLIHI